MYKLFFAGIVYISLVAPLSAEDPWITVGKTAESVFSIKEGSLSIEETKGGEGVAAVLGRVNNSDGTILIRQWYVSGEHCQREFGKLVTLDTNGNFEFDNDFAFNSGSVASSIAEMICAAIREAIAQVEEKGI